MHTVNTHPPIQPCIKCARIWCVLVYSVCVCVCVCVCEAHPVQLDGVDPLVSVLGVLCSEVPHAVVHTDVQPALVKLVRLRREEKRAEGE